VDVPEAVERLHDAQEIRDAVIRAARGADLRDPELLASSFWPEATVRYGTLPELSRDDLLSAWSTAAQACAATLHHLFNDRLELDGDVAHVETYHIVAFLPAHSVEDGSLLPFCGALAANHVGLQGGRYVDRLERRDGAWRIASRVVCGDWYATAPGEEIAAGDGGGGPPAGEGVPRAARAHVDELLARDAIRDTVYRYARGVDRVDLDLLAGVFVNIDNERELVDHLITQRVSRPVQCHYVTNLRVHLDAASARAEAYFIAAVCDAPATPRPVHLVGGRYVFDLVEQDGEWRIARRRLLVTWRATADGRHIEAFHRATGDKSRRSREDGSYAPLVVSGASRSIAELVDRDGVRDTLSRYARGCDRLDRPLLGSAFVDVAPQFVDYMFAQADVRPIQDHCWTNLRVELAGDGVACIEAYYISVHGYVDGAATGFIDGTTSSQEVNFVAGRYVRWLERVNGRWGLRNLSPAKTYPPPGGGLGDWHAVLDGRGQSAYLEATGNASRRRGGDDPSYRRT
jgi:hypothetical protein